jgi:hypothetical protein
MTNEDELRTIAEEKRLAQVNEPILEWDYVEL